MSVFSFCIHATTYLASWTVFGCHMNCLMLMEPRTHMSLPNITGAHTPPPPPLLFILNTLGCHPCTQSMKFVWDPATMCTFHVCPSGHGKLHDLIVRLQLKLQPPLAWPRRHTTRPPITIICCHSLFGAEVLLEITCGWTLTVVLLGWRQGWFAAA